MSKNKILKMVFLDLFGFGIGNIFYLMKLTKPKTFLEVISPLIFQTIVIFIMYKTATLPYLILWFGGIITGFWASFRMRVWTEHQGTKEAHRLHLSWIERQLFAPHNTWMHYEHHLAPSVPQHKLPELRKILPSSKIKNLDELFQSFEKSKVISSGEVIAD